MKNAESLAAVERERESLSLKDSKEIKLNSVGKIENKAVDFVLRKERENTKGITLIALIVTIIVLIILAGVSIGLINKKDGILTQAKKTSIINEFSKYKEELEIFKATEFIKDSNFYDQSITAGKNTLNYNTKNDKNSITRFIR